MCVPTCQEGLGSLKHTKMACARSCAATQGAHHSNSSNKHPVVVALQQPLQLSNSPSHHQCPPLRRVSTVQCLAAGFCFAKNQMQFPPSPPFPTARSMSVGCVGWWAGGGAGSGVNYLVRNRDRKVETLRDMFRPPFFFQMRKKRQKE